MQRSAMRNSKGKSAKKNYKWKSRKQNRKQRPQGKPEPVQGVLELIDDRQGFLRDPGRGFSRQDGDAYVPPEQMQKYQLRGGETVIGVAQRRQAKGGPAVTQVESINGVPAADWSPPTPLQDQVAIDPNETLHFSTPGGPNSMRIVELFTPIGCGQRGLIVAPPRTGKTVLLQQMANGIGKNHPDIRVIMLLIDERPEEVTDMRRNIPGEVIASSNDKDVDSHVRTARMVIAQAQRQVEKGEHIVIFLDSITRLARAFNSYVGSSGRTMTGGLDIRALQEPKQIFGAARNVENGGSLTIIATALIDTGSRADEFIFQEFKGTGNMELVLDRELANYRIWPAIDLRQSGTRKEEKLLSEDALQKQYMLRRQLGSLPPAKQITTILEKMERHESLQAFLDNLRV